MISALGSLGTASNKSAGTPLGYSPSRDVPVGRVVVLWVSTDSVHNAGDPHDNMQERWSAHDDAGNIWVTLGGATDGQGFFFTGSSAHIFISQLRSGLLTTDTVTIENQAEGNVTARCLSAEEFDFGTSYGGLSRWATTDSGPQVTSTVAGDPPPITISSLDSQEYLLLHCLGTEGPGTDSYTWDADYTQISSVATSGGAADSNITLRGGYRIATLTTDTVDVTNNTAARDNCQVLVATCATPPQHEFPVNPVLDDFNRANEEPLSDGGNWLSTNSPGPHVGATPYFLRLVSNAARGSSATGFGGQFWHEDFTGCVEVYVTVTQKSTGDAGGPSVTFHSSGAAELSTLGGYGAQWRNPLFGNTLYGNLPMGNIGNAGGLGGGSGNEYALAWIAQQDGYKLGASRFGDLGGNPYTDRYWLDVGAGWEEIAGIYRNSVNVDNTGKIALSTFSQNNIFDDFGGGEIECLQRRGRPQIMRYR